MEWRGPLGRPGGRRQVGGWCLLPPPKRSSDIRAAFAGRAPKCPINGIRRRKATLWLALNRRRREPRRAVLPRGRYSRCCALWKPRQRDTGRVCASSTATTNYVLIPTAMAASIANSWRAAAPEAAAARAAGRASARRRLKAHGAARKRLMRGDPLQWRNRPLATPDRAHGGAGGEERRQRLCDPLPHLPRPANTAQAHRKVSSPTRFALQSKPVLETQQSSRGGPAPHTRTHAGARRRTRS